VAVREFSYKGKDVKVDQPDDQHADVTIEDRQFAFMQHGDPLAMWMCDEAYFGSPDLTEAIRHIIDYWYIVVDDEHKAPVPGIEKHFPGAGGGGTKKKRTQGHQHGKGK
jgi:hypothetical protein